MQFSNLSTLVQLAAVFTAVATRSLGVTLPQSKRDDCYYVDGTMALHDYNVAEPSGSYISTAKTNYRGDSFFVATTDSSDAGHFSAHVCGDTVTQIQYHVSDFVSPSSMDLSD